VDWRLGHPTIEWCDFGDLAFTDPFFRHTYWRSRRTSPDGSIWETDLQDLLDQAGREGGLAPSGFIFHIGHCGSTLVSRLLASSDRVLCLSEPTALFDLFDFPDSATAHQRRELLRALIMVLGRRRRPSEGRYVVKFTSDHFLHFDLIAEVFPETPWVFVFREPTAAIRSQLSEPIEFRRIRRVEPFLQSSAATLASLPPEEFLGRLLAYMFEAALQRVGAVQGGQALFVDYQSLPTAIWTHVAPFFGFVPTNAETVRMQEQSRLYSKDPTSTRLFVQTTDAPVSDGRESGAAARNLLTVLYRKLQAVALQPR
jgi:hypothetical protein